MPCRPIGGVGINLAIQDAVATANMLGPVLQKGVPKFADLKKVQARREFPTRVIQAFQVAAQNRILAPTLRSDADAQAALFSNCSMPGRGCRQFPARFIGMGVRPEHVKLAKR